MQEQAALDLSDEGDRPWQPRLGLLSLWDIMMRVRVEDYIKLGIAIEDASSVLHRGGHDDDAQRREDDMHVRETIRRVAAECEKLGSKEMSEMLFERLKWDNIPTTGKEFDLLIEAARRQLKEQRLLVLQSGYYGRQHLSGDARAAFPKLTQELRSASNSYACGLDTACVFHCMRALEHALDAMASDCGLTWTKEQWHNIIEMIESSIAEQRKNLRKGAPKDERLNGLSQAAKEFFYFKDGWRNYVTHNRVSYGEGDARDALDHVRTFTERLVERLKLAERA